MPSARPHANFESCSGSSFLAISKLASRGQFKNLGLANRESSTHCLDSAIFRLGSHHLAVSVVATRFWAQYKLSQPFSPRTVTVQVLVLGFLISCQSRSECIRQNIHLFGWHSRFDRIAIEPFQPDLIPACSSMSRQSTTALGSFLVGEARASAAVIATIAP